MSDEAARSEAIRPGAEALAYTEANAALGGVTKRTFDLTVAVLLLFLLAPLIIGTVIALAIAQGRPVIIRHKRIGFGGRTFGCLKFRTMVLDADRVLHNHLKENETAREEWARDRKLRNDPRVTRLGAILRRTSIDELPQLINIVSGDMSVIGPRPIVEAEVSKYGVTYLDYKCARPGLTGAWQVSGRNDLDYAARVRLDRDYVRTWSFGSDAKILVKTVPAVLSRRGCY